jgi:hypothetical protein
MRISATYNEIVPLKKGQMVRLPDPGEIPELPQDQRRADFVFRIRGGVPRLPSCVHLD